MDPTDLRALLAPLIAEEADYVKGNRLDVQDSQCGYAAINRRTQQTLDWERLWKGYGYPNDLLSWLAVCGLRVRDVPVRPVYGSEQSGIRLRGPIVERRAAMQAVDLVHSALFGWPRAQSPLS
jgi:hypothetical protein